MSDNYTGVLLEDVDSKLDLILENMGGLATKKDVQALDDRLTKVEADVTTIKLVVTETNRDLKAHTEQLNNHETRITSLETPT